MDHTIQPAKPAVVGWGSVNARWADADTWSASRALADGLYRIGIRQAFGVLGGGIAPFSAGMAASPLQFYHFRHEAGAGFAAIEAQFASETPSAVIVTTGPGIANVLNPIWAARKDGAKILLVSGFTSRMQHKRGAVQETSPETMPSELVRPGSLFHDVLIPESPEELPPFLERLHRAWAGPQGWVAHLGLPLSLQTQIVDGPLRLSLGWQVSRPAPSEQILDECLDALRTPNALIWVGFGSRHAAESLRAFAELAQLPVIVSPRAKGVFPERHPLFAGVSGAGGSALVAQRFEKQRPEALLVVGTRLGEVTSFLNNRLTPSKHLFHVDIDPSAFGSAFPHVPGTGIIADSDVFFRQLSIRANANPSWIASRRNIPSQILDSQPKSTSLMPLNERAIRPDYLMQVIQRTMIEDLDSIIMSESGTSFTWCNSHLKFDSPGRYRTSAAWGSMGHFTTGCVGACLASNRRIVSVVGDGAMLMNNEINTAVQYETNPIWIVLNDAQLGLNEHGMTALGMKPVETQMPRTDFVSFARSQGADGICVKHETDLEDALLEALASGVPFVVDVQIDRTIPSPVVADRIKSLNRQAANR